MASPIYRLGVRDLVQHTCQRGDLYPGRGAARTTGEEGVRTQRHIQRQEVQGYRTEVALTRHFVVAGVSLLLQGRADGLLPEADEESVTLDEIKTSRTDPALLLQQQGHLHWAQLRIYAALLWLQQPRLANLRMRLRYVHPDTLAEQVTVETESRDTLLSFLQQCLVRYGERFAEELQRRRRRNADLSQLQFPMPEFRPNQRALAGRVYAALRSEQSLLLEAATGIGKSLGIVFPAARAFGNCSIERYFYLTARRTGALAAVRALQQLHDAGAPLVWVQLAAKEQMCRQPGTAQEPGPPCDPRSCPKAMGYYDRVDDALAELLPLQQLASDVISEVAQRHQVCPFEMSLDAARWSDVIIGDYNYVFDPDVRLQRFADGRDSALLIDEAHQLAPRAMDMLGANLDQGALKTARKTVTAGPLRKRLDSVNRALNALRRAYPGGVVSETDALNRAIERLLGDAVLLDWERDISDDLAQLLWDSQRWLKRMTLTATLPRLLLLETVGNAIRVRLECLDPALYLQPIFKRFRADVRFSATLRPVPLYQQQHGREDAASAQIASPYQAAQLKVCVIPDVPTYYRQRQRSLPKLAQLIAAVAASQAGGYLVALPSFDYLDQLEVALAEQAQVTLIRQSRAMQQAQREQFLLDLAQATTAAKETGQAVLALVVLGGVFAESVDFTGIALRGVISVGVGLAPPSVVSSARQQHYDAQQRDGTLDGTTVAHIQPAMVKVVQMAGRLLRDPTDKGVVALVDGRFQDGGYQQFFPDHWHPERTLSKDLPAALAKFWSGV